MGCGTCLYIRVYDLQVSSCCNDVRAGLTAEVCGSYRRGRDTCGDVDVLVTHPDGRSHKGVFTKLLAYMREKG